MVNNTKQAIEESRATWRGITAYLQGELAQPLRLSETGQSVRSVTRVLTIARSLTCPRPGRIGLRPNGALRIQAPDPRSSTLGWGGSRQRAQRLKDEPLELK